MRLLIAWRKFGFYSVAFEMPLTGRVSSLHYSPYQQMIDCGLPIEVDAHYSKSGYSIVIDRVLYRHPSGLEGDAFRAYALKEKF